MKYRLKQMLIKEFLHMFRDVRMRMVVMVMPLTYHLLSRIKVPKWPHP